jgi:hypothetical protein
VWLSLEEAAVLLGLLELLASPAGASDVEELRERWQGRLGTRMSEVMTGLAPDGFDADDSLEA